MGSKTLPRHLEYAINRLANLRTQGRDRSAYQREKVRILKQVVCWLADGKSLDEVVDILAVPNTTELQKTVRALVAEIWKQP